MGELPEGLAGPDWERSRPHLTTGLQVEHGSAHGPQRNRVGRQATGDPGPRPEWRRGHGDVLEHVPVANAYLCGGFGTQ